MSVARFCTRVAGAKLKEAEGSGQEVVSAMDSELRIQFGDCER